MTRVRSVSVVLSASNGKMAVAGRLQWLSFASRAVLLSFCIPFVCPPCCFLAHAGIGGDAFCLYFDAKTKKVSAMLGNGGAPGALTLQVTE